MAIEDITDIYWVQINQQEFCQSVLLQLTPVTTGPVLPYKASSSKMKLWKKCSHSRAYSEVILVDATHKTNNLDWKTGLSRNSGRLASEASFQTPVQ